jgi:hypothetical protein
VGKIEKKRIKEIIMPTPIKPVKDDSSPKSAGSDNYFMDYSFLADVDFATYSPVSKKFVTATNNDAKALYDLWEKGKHVGEENYKFEKAASSQEAGLSQIEIARLKNMGFIEESSHYLTFTDKGKKLITTMTLSEPNRFELKAERKPYNEILANMTSKTKKTGSIKIASNNNGIDLSKI